MSSSDRNFAVSLGRLATAHAIILCIGLFSIILASSGEAHACTCDAKGNCVYSGELQMTVRDFPDGTTQTKFDLRKHDTGEILGLEFKGKVPKYLAPGNKVKVEGTRARGRKSFVVAADKNGRSKLTRLRADLHRNCGRAKSFCP